MTELSPFPPADENPVITMTTDADGAVPIVDWVAVDHYFEGDRKLVSQLVILALQTQAETAAQLRVAAEQLDWEQIIYLAHNLKSLCGHLQSRRACQLAKWVEQSARQQQPDTWQHAQELAAVLDELLVALAAHQDSVAEPSSEARVEADFTAQLGDFVDALRSRRMDAWRLAEALQDRLPDDSRRPALEAAIREALRLEFVAALAHLESVFAAIGTGGR
ncbi:MAG: Hpt domain-containing protein [Candidatus Competibacteraceae bacterium]